MYLENSSNLTIRSLDFNLLPSHPQLVKQLRKLTLHPRSGMNREMNVLFKIIEKRPVEAQVLLAYRSTKLVAWALLSREHSNMVFSNTWKHFEPTDGMLVEIYVDPTYRRQGIGSVLMKVARRKAGSRQLCVAPWDELSRAFYQTFPNYKNKWM